MVNDKGGYREYALRPQGGLLRVPRTGRSAAGARDHIKDPPIKRTSKDSKAMQAPTVCFRWRPVEKLDQQTHIKAIRFCSDLLSQRAKKKKGGGVTKGGHSLAL